jgi:hypothetical protein
MSAPPWEAFLAEHFPGYLLPAAYLRAVPEDVAARFLERTAGSPRQLFLLRAASVLSACSADVRELALTHLPDVARRLRARTETERRDGAGALRGRLDVPATARLRVAGRIDAIVARTRRPPRFAPEDVLLAAVAARLASVLGALRDAGVLGPTGWGADLVPCEEAFGRALAVPALAAASALPVAAVHEQAALAAPHPAHALALALHRALRRALDGDDLERIGRTLAEGALAPLADHTRFELAVLLRLVEALAARPGVTLRRAPVVSGRRHVAELSAGDGRIVCIHYDQAVLDPGPYDAGLRRYFARRGRLRPDVTVICTAPDRAPRATLIEAKLSEDPAYLVEGYREAMLYLVEHGAALTGWPRVILVTSAPLAAEPCRDDEVVAVGWDRWVPEVIADALLDF